MKNSFRERRFSKHMKLIDSFERAIKDGPWDKSPLLKIFKTKLQDLKDMFCSEIGIDDYMKGEKLSIKEKRTEQLKVFVSIYNSDGNDLDKWSFIIQGIVNKTVTRSVYRVEEDIREIIKSKKNPQNEGYVILYVNNNDLVISQDTKSALDELGHELCILKDKSIKNENIIKFVHNSESYIFKFNKLITEKLS